MAIFDGKNLTIYEIGIPIHKWSAVSGRPSYQDPSYQREKGKGPLPEGMYLARQSKYQERSEQNFIERAISLAPGKWTAWPGGSIAWGEQRVWLEPSKDTNTYGRDNFSIHGGSVPGSAGCIDLTGQMSEFAQWYKENDKDIIIHVKY